MTTSKTPREDLIKKGSGTFFPVPGSSARPNLQSSLCKRFDLQSEPFAAPCLLLPGGESQRVCVAVGQSIIEDGNGVRVPSVAANRVYVGIGALLIFLFALLVGAEWLELQWWAVGIGIGLLCFAFFAFLPGIAPTFNAAWFSLGLSACIMGAAWLIARFHDVPLLDLPNDQIVYRKIRRLPGYAVAVLTFSLATFVAALLRRVRLPASGRARKH